MANVNELKNVWKRKPLGFGIDCGHEPPIVRCYDLARILESVITIEAISSQMERPSSHVMEEQLGMVHPRKDGFGVASSGRIAKSRRGDNSLDPPLLERLKRLAWQAWPRCNPIIWELIRSGKLESKGGIGGYNAFSQPVRKVLHHRAALEGIYHGGSSFQPIMLHYVRYLVVLGTLDAIAALWRLLLHALEKDVENVLLIASHIPPALAMFYRRPEGKRTAILLFARMRQLSLDHVQVEGHELSLCRYDLIAAANQVVAWQVAARHTEQDSAMGKLFVPGMSGEMGAAGSLENEFPVSPDAVAWIERWRAPLRRAGCRPAKAAKWAYPAKHPLFLINEPHVSRVTWGKKAIDKFRAELGDYFCENALLSRSELESSQNVISVKRQA